MTGWKESVGAAERKRRQLQSQQDKAAHRKEMQKAQQPKKQQGPQPKKNSAPKPAALPRVPRSGPSGTKGARLYDAFLNDPSTPVLSTPVGPATAHAGFTRLPIPSIGTQGRLTDNIPNSTLIAFTPGHFGTGVGMIARFSAFDTPEGTTGVRCYVKPIVVPQFEQSGPEGIPLRGSVRLTNVTEALSRGGTVRVLRYNGDLNPPLPRTADIEGRLEAQWLTDIKQMIRESARTEVYSGANLVNPLAVHSYPADLMKSCMFKAKPNDTGFAEWTLPINAFRDATTDLSYCVILILIDDFSPSLNGHNNAYELEVMVHRAVRYEPGTAMHTLARPLGVNSSAGHAAVAEQTAPHGTLGHTLNGEHWMRS